MLIECISQWKPTPHTRRDLDHISMESSNYGGGMPCALNAAQEANDAVYDCGDPAGAVAPGPRQWIHDGQLHLCAARHCAGPVRGGPGQRSSHRLTTAC